MSEDPRPSLTWRERWLVRAALAGRPGGRLGARIREKVRVDPALAAAYDAMRHAERALVPERAVSVDQQARIKGALFDQLDAEGALDGARRPASQWRWAPVALAAAAGAALLVVGLPAAPDAPSDAGPTWQARGAPTAGVGLRARCVSADGGAVLAEAEAGRDVQPIAPSALRCPRDAVLVLSATNLGDRSTRLFVAGVSDDAEPSWIEPFASVPRSVALPARSADRLLEPASALMGLPQGRHRLFGLFTDDDVRGHDIERALRSARDQRLDPARAPRLAVDAPRQVVIDLVITAPSSSTGVDDGGGR